MISPGKGQAPGQFVATSVVTAFVAVVAIGVTINELAVAGTDAPANFADCILDKMRNVNSDQAAKLIADSCAEKFPKSAPATIKPLFAEPDGDLPEQSGKQQSKKARTARSARPSSGEPAATISFNSMASSAAARRAGK